jgi:TPR repeat protein
MLGCYYRDNKKYNLMKKYFDMAIKKLNTCAMIQLGIYYLENTNNNLKTKKLLNQALKLKDNDAIIPLSFYYHKIKDYDNQKKYLELACENNIEDSKYYLGKYYWEVEENSDKMKELLTQCSGEVAGDYLGRYFFLNVMNNFNPKEKEKYIIKHLDKKEFNKLEITNKDEINTNNNLGITFHEKVGYCYMCKSNDCCEREIYESQMLFNKGAACEQKGEYDKMKEYYQLAIAKNNTLAMVNMGVYYFEIEEDYEEMKKYYIMAIDSDESEGMFNLGEFYGSVDKNYKEMIKYYLMACYHSRLSRQGPAEMPGAG